MSRPFTNLSDSFKILRDNLNTVSYNIGDPASLTTYGDSDVVQAINEIENVFDASSGEILYPTGATGETQTRLLISTNQSSGTDVQINVGANFNVDAVGDINLDAGGANINFLDDATTRMAYALGATNVLSVTGSYRLVSSDSCVIQATNDINMVGANFTVDVSGDIILDADGDDVIFKNGSAEYGKLTNNAGNLEIYGGGVASANLAFTLRDNNISVSNPLSLDSSLGTSSQTVAGSLNEIHTELDSAVGEIETVKDTIENMLKVFDSGGTSANISATGISTLSTLDKTFVGGINEIDARLDSAVSEIESVKGTVETNVVNIADLDSRVGQLSNLDSSTTGGFFDSDGTNGNLVKALNELARRAVLIYDESGTLLN